MTEQELNRLRNLELSLNQVMTALQNVASKRQLNQLLAVLQTENKQLRADIEQLQSEVALLKTAR